MAKPTIENELVLAMDFDGLITTKADISTEPLSLQEGAKEVLTRMHEDGIRLLLWTCRTGPALDLAKVFLEEEDLLQVFEQINEHCEEVIAQYSPNVSRKLGADAYFDDKNLGAVYIAGYAESGDPIVSWKKIEELIYGD